jgi:hypothetical protein
MLPVGEVVFRRTVCVVTSCKSSGPADVLGLVRLTPHSHVGHHLALHSFACFWLFYVFPGPFFANARPQPAGTPASPRIRGPFHEATYTCLRDPRVAEARLRKINPPPPAPGLTRGVGPRREARGSRCASLAGSQGFAASLSICGPAPSRALSRSAQLGLARSHQDRARRSRP